MSSFSNISKIEIENFMSIKHGLVTYEDSEGILNIKGFNDSGKSALLLAVAVCFTNAYPQRQKSFIRDGEQYFRVVVTFDDGVSIVRDKYAEGSSMYEMLDADGNVTFTTRYGDALSKVDAVPDVIAEYLGLFNEDSFHLNFRRKSDPLLLASTSGSENFRILNAVLKTEELSQAAQAASKDANDRNRDVQNLDVKRMAIEQELSSIWSSEALVKELELRSSEESNLVEAQGNLKKLSTSIPVEVKLPEMSRIDFEELSKLTELQGVLSKTTGVTLPSLQVLDDSRLSILEKLAQTSKGMSEALPKILTVNGGLLQELQQLSDSFDKISDINKEMSESDEVLLKLHTAHTTLVDKARAAGMELIECPKCGEVTVK